MRPQGTKRRLGPQGIVLFSVGLFLAVALVVTLWEQIAPRTAGWPRDVTVEEGGRTMLLQFKVDPDPPAVGTATVMARVKDTGGFPMFFGVDYVRFAVSKGERISPEVWRDNLSATSGPSVTGFTRPRSSSRLRRATA